MPSARAKSRATLRLPERTIPASVSVSNRTSASRRNGCVRRTSTCPSNWAPRSTFQATKRYDGAAWEAAAGWEPAPHSGVSSTRRISGSSARYRSNPHNSALFRQAASAGRCGAMRSRTISYRSWVSAECTATIVTVSHASLDIPKTLVGGAAAGRDRAGAAEFFGPVDGGPGPGRRGAGTALAHGMGDPGDGGGRLGLRIPVLAPPPAAHRTAEGLCRRTRHRIVTTPAAGLAGRVGRTGRVVGPRGGAGQRAGGQSAAGGRAPRCHLDRHGGRRACGGPRTARDLL